ncbi:MAG: hypothetical protein JWM32_2560 [Verrucomicrobia bacterium]|nr:hypothetical protein [Verrucomicrobiota bacterium]
MKKFLAGAAAVFLGVSRLCAGEWLPWHALSGKQIPERAGIVEIRFRRDEAGDDRQRGYLFHYELRNLSSAQVAKVSLAFAWQDPKSRKWEDASIGRAIIFEVGPKASSPTGSIYSPEPTGIDHGVLIVWQDDFTPKPGEEKPGQADRSSTLLVR